MTVFGPLDFLRAAQFLRSGNLDDFAEAVPGRPPAPGSRTAQSEDQGRMPLRRSA